MLKTLWAEWNNCHLRRLHWMPTLCCGAVSGCAPSVLQPRVCTQKICWEPLHRPLEQCLHPHHSSWGTVFPHCPSNFQHSLLLSPWGDVFDDDIEVKSFILNSWGPGDNFQEPWAVQGPETAPAWPCSLLPPKQLNSQRGLWSYFVGFIRHLLSKSVPATLVVTLSSAYKCKPLLSYLHNLFPLSKNMCVP